MTDQLLKYRVPGSLTVAEWAQLIPGDRVTVMNSTGVGTKLQNGDIYTVRRIYEQSLMGPMIELQEPVESSIGGFCAGRFAVVRNEPTAPGSLTTELLAIFKG